jgi:hypothetical protein
LPKPDAWSLKPVRPQASLEFVRTDFTLHRIEELRPLVCLELGDQLPRLLGLAFRAGQVIDHFVDLVKDLEDVGAFGTFIIVEGHKTPPSFSGIELPESGPGKKEGNLSSSPMPESGIRKPIAR